MRNMMPNPKKPRESQNILAIALLLSLIGYEVFAPLIQATGSESSVPSVAIRVATLLFCVAAVWRMRQQLAPVSWALLPMLALLSLYGLRLFDNFFVRSFTWEADPVIAFTFLIGASLVPAVLLQRCIANLDALAVSRWIGVSLGIFLLGMALAWNDVLLSFVASRLVMTKLNPIALGYLCTTIMVWLMLRPPTGIGSTLAWALGLTALLMGLLLSQARGQLLGLAALLPLMLYAGEPASRRKLMWSIGLPIALLAALVAWLEIDLIGMVFDRFEKLDTEDSADGRRLAWAAAWSQFLESPWIGDKVFEPTLLHYPHNILLEGLISLGLPGGCLVAVHLAITLWSCARILANRASSAVSQFIALVAIKEWIAVQLSGAIWSDNAFWILSACVIGLAFTPTPKASETKFLPGKSPA